MNRNNYLQLFHILQRVLRYDKWKNDKVSAMFGYVRLHKPEIKMGEYEQYQGVYCTLCRRLGKFYGPAARMTLSYDMTFLALLDMALEETDPAFCPGRCSFNPTKRCLKAGNTRAIDRAAHVGIILAYYKLKDTLADEGFWKKAAARGALLFIAPSRKKAAKRLPHIDRAAADMMAAQAAVESANAPSIDKAAEPFARLLQTLAGDLATDDRQRLILERFGYCLGRWVYLMDAVDDLATDLKSGNYNPYIRVRELQPGDSEGVKAARDYAILTLNACLAECTAAYNLLEIRRFDGILRNILELGMPTVQRRVVAGEEHT